MKARPQVIGPIGVAICFLTVMLAYWPTYRKLLAIGATGDDLTHRIFVIPIFLFLIWGLRSTLSTLSPRTFSPGLFPIVCVGALWLFAELALIRVFTEAAAIAMVPLVVLTVFGYRWLWALGFPLFFLLFLIPIRDPLVGLQVDMTAKVVHVGLLASGIPVYREGPYFELPSGKWSVAEACSGIEYLSACLMLAVLYAWTFYASTKKRLVFIAGAFLVGIGGNWLRAYLTIGIAHISDNRLLRSGHGTFGWLLFAAILLFYCWLGWRFRDQQGVPANFPGEIRQPEPIHHRTFLESGWKHAAIAIATAVAVGIWPLINLVLAKKVAPSQVTIADAVAAAGWTKVEKSFVDWQPTLINPTAERTQVFEKGGRQVALFIGVFANQTWTSKLVTSVNHFIPAEGNRWTQVSRGTVNIDYLDKPLRVKTGMIVGGDSRIVARRWYWIHGRATSGDMQAKIDQVQARFAGLADISAWITVYTIADNSPDLAEATLTEFVRDLGGAIELALSQTVQS